MNEVQFTLTLANGRVQIGSSIEMDAHGQLLFLKVLKGAEQAALSMPMPEAKGILLARGVLPPSGVAHG